MSKGFWIWAISVGLLVAFDLVYLALTPGDPAMTSYIISGAVLYLAIGVVVLLLRRSGPKS